MVSASAGRPARFKFAASGLQVVLGNELRYDRCQAGAVSALPTPIRNVNNKRLPGVVRPNQTIAANIAEMRVTAISTFFGSRREAVNYHLELLNLHNLA
jgi:hypothetical protein